MIKDKKDQPIKVMYFDTETVTLENPVNCCAFFQLGGIIEIDGVEVERFNFHLNPNEEFEYNEDCLIFNNITRDDLNLYPSHEDVYEEFIAILDKHVDKFDKNDKIHTIGFNNAPFDNPKLWEWFAGMDVKKDSKYCTIGSYFWSNTIDVFPLTSLLFIKYRGLFPNFKLRTIIEKLAQMNLLDKKYLNDTNWHDAVFDIEATRDLFHLVTKMFKMNIFEKSV